MKKKNPIRVSGSFLYFDVKNKNGILYRRGNVFEAVENYRELVNNGSAVGELGFPSTSRFEVSLANASHRITEMHYNEDSNSLDGTIEILESTPAGKILLDVIKHNPTKFTEMYCVRSRGTGTINENGEVENYKLFSFDVIPRCDDSFSTKEPMINGVNLSDVKMTNK